MPRDSNGNTQPLGGTIVSTGDPILPSQHNPALVDLYEMMSQSLSRDGQGGMRANLNMNGYRITNVAAGTATGDVATVGQVSNAVPVGTVVDFAGVNSPEGWMFCHGQAISRTDYSALFSVLGTTYGGSGGSFNLPDCRGRVIAGRDDMGGSDAGRLSFFGSVARAIGGVLGTASHVLTIGEMPSHNHGGGVTGGGEHGHTINRRRYAQANTANVGGYIGEGTGYSDSVNFGGWHSHGINSQGGGAAHANVQPTIIMNKIIKVR